MDDDNLLLRAKSGFSLLLTVAAPLQSEEDSIISSQLGFQEGKLL